MNYEIRIVYPNMDGVCEGSCYTSDSPVTIPNAGDAIHIGNEHLDVLKRIFWFSPGQITVDVVCKDQKPSG